MDFFQILVFLVVYSLNFDIFSIIFPASNFIERDVSYGSYFENFCTIRIVAYLQRIASASERAQI